MTAINPYGLPPATLARLNEIFAAHPAIARVLLYGSRAKGNYRPGSDIDLTIQGEALSLTELARIEDEIDELYLPYTVDLSQYRHIDNPALHEHIERVGVVIYERVGEGER